MQENFIESAKKQFEYYKMLGEKTFDQLAEEELFWKYNEESNSIAVLVNHLSGNMLSRWTDFLIADGEKESRNRDAEFEDEIKTKDELLQKWETGWTCLFKALDSVNANNLETIIYIRNLGHTVIEAISRQLSHYAYHVGQLVFIGKMIKHDTWQSLSIPKGNSAVYNEKKFAKTKCKEHFTEEFLNDLNIKQKE